MAEPTRVDAVSRRTVLKGMAGAAGLVSIPAIIAACSSTTASSAPSCGRQRSSGQCSVASTPPASAAAVGTRDHRKLPHRPRRAGGAGRGQRRVHGGDRHHVVMNTVDHSTFQNQISNYLGGTPDDGVHVVLRLPDEVLRRQGPERPGRRRLGEGQGQLHRRLPEGGRRQRRQGLRHPGRLLPVGRLLSQERLHRQGLHRPGDLGRSQGPLHEDADATASSRSRSATRTAGPRWARSTSSTCA